MNNRWKTWLTTILVVLGIGAALAACGAGGNASKSAGQSSARFFPIVST